MSCSDARLHRLRNACSEEGYEAFFACNTSDIRWVSGFDGVFDSERAHGLYVDGKRAVLHTDSRYSTALEARSAGGPLRVVTEPRSAESFVLEQWKQHCASKENLEGALGVGGIRDTGDRLGAEGALGIEDTLTLGEYRRLQEAFVDANIEQPFCETHDFILTLRASKDGEEIKRMKAAQAITDSAFGYIVSFMKPGMSEREVQIELESFMLRAGADGLAFSSIVATGANGASPHAIPGDTKLEAGQCVVLDFGARFAGYCSDMTRTVFLGEPDALMRQAFETMREANEQVESFLRSGVTGAEAHYLAEQILADGGFGGLMGHGLGHGVGLDIHELPVLSPRNLKPLEVGNVVTVEPGIYLPGRFGMRLEDFGVIEEQGFSVFTQSTHDIVII